MRRREFLIGAAAAAGFASRSTGWTQNRDQAKLARVAIMSLSFGGVLKNINVPDSPERVIDIVDIGQMYADRFGIHNVELQHGHIPSTEESWLKEFRRRLAKTKSQITQINIEIGPMNISAPEPVLRLQAIDLTKRWIEHAVTLGCPRVMVNQGTLSQQNKQIAIATLKPIVEYGKSRRILVSAENRGGSPSPGAPPVAGPPAYELLLEVLKSAGARATCDLGNFPDQETQRAGVPAMLALENGNCHVKLRYDVPAALAMTRELGYNGLFSIEASTRMGPDPYANTQKILDVITSSI
jgi:sugar phosphate isomerase/epimerase